MSRFRRSTLERLINWWWDNERSYSRDNSPQWKNTDLPPCRGLLRASVGISRRKNRAGETPFECLTRELREELNIEIKPLREYCRSVCGELSFVFIEAEIISGEPQLSVHEEMRWVLPNELTAFEWCPADRPVAEEISKSTEHTNNPLR